LQADDDIHAAVTNWLARRKYEKLCSFWVKGWPIDWTARYFEMSSVRPRVLSLPPYPFVRDRHWVDLAAPREEPGSAIHLLEPAWEARPAQTGILPRPGARVVLVADCFASHVEEFQSRHPEARCAVLGSAPGSPAERFEALAMVLMGEIQALLKQGLSQPLHVQLVLPAHEGDWVALSGMLKTARHEAPMLEGQVLVLDEGLSSSAFRDLLDANAARFAEEEVRYCEGVRQVRALARLEYRGSLPRAIWKPGGIYLVTGGAGAIARVFASEIFAAASDAFVILVGRNLASEAMTTWLAQARLAGARVEYRCVDVSDAAAVGALVEGVVLVHGRLDGVIHAAGTLSDGWVIDKTAEQVHEVLHPKVRGVINLDLATAHLPLDLFVAFSSLAGILGNAGQSDYAAANAFLDSYVAHRAVMVRDGRRSGRSLSVAWPLWRAGGMQLDAVTVDRIREELGLVPIDNAEAIEAFYRAHAAPGAVVAVIKGDLARFERARSPQTDTDESVTGAGARASVPDAAGTGDSATLREAVAAHLAELLGRTLKLSPDKVASDTPMENFGIDSVVALEMVGELERTFGKLPKTLFFQYPSIDAISEYLVELSAGACARLAPDMTDRSAATPGAGEPDEVGQDKRETAARSSGSTDIAIVGIAGRYPDARNLEQFWDNLVAGRESVGEIPASRWDFRPYFDAEKGKPGALYCKWGGFIEGVDEFDALFFNVAPLEAQTMGPQERLFLQCAYEAIESAGYTRANVSSRRVQGRERNVGVFAGVMYDEYQLFNLQTPGLGSSGPSSNPASVANRVSYFCDFRGPSMAVNTMCSSSLTAIHMACESLRSGNCEVAIAGGVNLSIHPGKYITLSQGHFVSAKGRCSSFGDGADGYVPGEGVGAVLLKPLADAIADGDHIHAVIKASGINHGGKGNGYTVPHLRAQTDLVRQLLDEARIAPAAVSYVEAHGTGTTLGDPIEIQALAEAFGGVGDQGATCAVGSVKTNIGHLESAAGIAGLTKVVLQLKHRTIAPSLHSRALNANIDFASTPFFVPQEAREWTTPAARVGAPGALPRIAGISSFGAGGANAHVIVAEHEPAAAPQIVHGNRAPVLVVLSARRENHLALMAARLRQASEFLEDGDLERIAFTLQTGREGMAYRLAFTVDSLAALQSKLDQIVSGETLAPGIHQGTAQRHPSSGNEVGSWLDKAAEPVERTGALEKLAARWVRGFGIDWDRLYPAGHPRRIALPTYPFERKRHWVDNGAPAVVAVECAPGIDVTSGEIHPLLHVSRDSAGLCFTSEFSGDEFFLCQHVVAGRKVLPAAAYLEMASAAANIASPAFATHERSSFSICDVSWSRAVVAPEGGVGIVTEIDLLEDGGIAFRVCDRASAAEGGVYAQGRVSVSDAPDLNAAARDLAALRATSRRVLSGSECYEIFRQTGIEYGEAFRGLEALHFGTEDGREFAIGSFALPECELPRAGAFGLHPAILDLAFQSFLGVALQRHGGETSGGLPVLEIPFALDALHVAGPLPTAGHIVATACAGKKIDVTIYDRDGRVAARLEGISVRRVARGVKADVGAAMLLEPKWKPVKLSPVRAWPDTAARVLVIGGRSALRQDVCQRFPNHVIASNAAEAAGLVAASSLDHLIWLVPAGDRDGPDPDLDLIAAQEEGTIAGFRLVRALLDVGYGSRPLGWTIVTAGTQPVVPGGEIDAAHAGLHGFFGAIAREYGNWRVRLVDLAVAAVDAPSADLIWSLEPAPEGGTLAIRQGLVYRQRLVPRPKGEGRPASPYRMNGVYVIVGGAGGVGEALTIHLVEAFQAQVIWLGRRELDSAIEAKLDGVACLGPRPLYVQADAADAASLGQAVGWIKARYPRIDGVVSAALELADRAIFNMDEATFRRVLRSKVDVSCNIAHLFAREPLDFLLFFSSMQSFGRPPGQSNYCAGSTFVDAFSAQLGSRPGAVRTINWGYWGHAGAAASPEVQARMADAGIGSIDPVRGIAALDELLTGDARQLAFVVRLGPGVMDAFLDEQDDAAGPARSGSAPALLRKLRDRHMKVAAE